MPSDGTDLARAAGTQKILWILFLATTLLYLVVALLLAGTRSAPAEPNPVLGTLRIVFLFLGAILLLLAFWIRRALLARTPAPGPDRSRQHMTASVIGWGMLETIAILGLLLVILGGGLLDAVPYFLVAVLGILRQRPGPAGLDLGPGTPPSP